MTINDKCWNFKSDNGRTMMRRIRISALNVLQRYSFQLKSTLDDWKVKAKLPESDPQKIPDKISSTLLNMIISSLHDLILFGSFDFCLISISLTWLRATRPVHSASNEWFSLLTLNSTWYCVSILFSQMQMSPPPHLTDDTFGLINAESIGLLCCSKFT